MAFQIPAVRSVPAPDMASLATHPFSHGFHQPFLAMPPAHNSFLFPQHQHPTAPLRSSPSERSCDLCSQPAALRCDADSAFLCAACDSAVHSANFIVLRHSRRLLCAVCSSPTSWEAPALFQRGPCAGDQTQALCDSCLALGAATGIAANAVHAASAMSANMAASLFPIHAAYAAAFPSTAFAASPASEVGAPAHFSGVFKASREPHVPASCYAESPRSGVFAPASKRYRASATSASAGVQENSFPVATAGSGYFMPFSQYPPHAKLSQAQQQQLPSLLLAGTSLSQNSIVTANHALPPCPLSASSSSSPPETLELFPTSIPSNDAADSVTVTRAPVAESCEAADVAGVVPDLNESFLNDNQTVPDNRRSHQLESPLHSSQAPSFSGKRQREEEQQVADEAQIVLGGNSIPSGQGRNVLGQLAAARLKRVLSSWYARLALRGPRVADLAFHIFQKVLIKLQPGRVAADSLRVTLAACMWTAAKLDDNQKTLPKASVVAAVARVPAQRLQAAELDVMKLVGWRPLEGYTGFDR